MVGEYYSEEVTINFTRELSDEVSGFGALDRE